MARGLMVSMARARRRLTEVGEGDAVVFLQHAPGNEEAAAASGVGLMLNGHTHGGQIWPFHSWCAAPTRISPECIRRMA